MTTLYRLLAVFLLVGLAPWASAQDFKYFVTIGVTSDYVSSGVSQSNGKPAVQPYMEVELNGGYTGIRMSTVDLDTDDDIELDLYFGYRKLFETGLFLDFGYARYFFDRNGDCCGDVKFTAAYSLMDKIGLKAAVSLNPQSLNYNRSASAAYAFSKKVAVSGRYGRDDLNRNEFWDAGATLALNKNVKFDARYHGATTGNAGVVVSLIFTSSDVNFGRMFIAPFN